MASAANPQLLEVLQGVANGSLTPNDGAMQLGQLVGQSRLGASGVAVERAAFPEVGRAGCGCVDVCCHPGTAPGSGGCAGLLPAWICNRPAAQRNKDVTGRIERAKLL